MKNCMKTVCAMLFVAGAYFPLISHAADYMGSHPSPDGGRCYHYGNWWTAGGKVYANKGTNCQKEQEYIGNAIEMYRNGRNIQDGYIERMGASGGFRSYTKSMSATAQYTCKGDTSTVSLFRMKHSTFIGSYNGNSYDFEDNWFFKNYYFYCN